MHGVSGLSEPQLKVWEWVNTSPTFREWGWRLDGGTITGWYTGRDALTLVTNADGLTSIHVRFDDREYRYDAEGDYTRFDDEDYARPIDWLLAWLEAFRDGSRAFGGNRP